MEKNYNSHPTFAEELSLKSRSRQELAQAYWVSTRTFRRWLKQHHIELPPGLIKPADVRRIFMHLGPPGE